jgi:hypothetical protein
MEKKKCIIDDVNRKLPENLYFKHIERLDKRSKIFCKCGYPEKYGESSWEIMPKTALNRAPRCIICRNTMESVLDKYVKNDISVVTFHDGEVLLQHDVYHCGHTWTIKIKTIYKEVKCPTCERSIKLSNIYNEGRNEKESRIFHFQYKSEVLLKNKNMSSENKKKIKIRHEQRLNDVKKRLPDNLVISNFKTQKDKANLRCSLCNYPDTKKGETWTIYPKNLTKNTKCPKCRNNKGKIEDKLKEIPKSMELIEFKGLSRYSTIRCNLCNHRYQTYVKNLHPGSRCPNCNNTGISNSERYKSLCRNIEIIEYINTNKKCKVKCNIEECGNIWDIHPANIREGTKCPKCRSSSKSKEFLSYILEEAHMFPSDTNIQRIDQLDEFAYDSYTCYLCSNVTETSISKMMRGIVCPHCHDKFPDKEYDRFKSYGNARNIKIDLLKFTQYIDENGNIKEILFSQNDEKKPDLESEIEKILNDGYNFMKNRHRFDATCSRGHKTENITLKDIKSKLNSDFNNWCEICDDKSNFLDGEIYQRASELSMEYIPNDNYQNLDSEIKMRCFRKTPHIINITANNIMVEDFECRICSSSSSINDDKDEQMLSDILSTMAILENKITTYINNGEKDEHKKKLIKYREETIKNRREIKNLPKCKNESL